MLCDGRDTFPSVRELREAGYAGLAQKLADAGELDRWAAEFELPRARVSAGQRLAEVRDDDGLLTELREFCAGRAVFPSKREFVEAGRRPLFRRMAARGGAARWAPEVGLPIAKPGRSAAAAASGPATPQVARMSAPARQQPTASAGTEQERRTRPRLPGAARPLLTLAEDVRARGVLDFRHRAGSDSEPSAISAEQLRQQPKLDPGSFATVSGAQAKADRIVRDLRHDGDCGRALNDIARWGGHPRQAPWNEALRVLSARVAEGAQDRTSRQALRLFAGLSAEEAEEAATEAIEATRAALEDWVVERFDGLHGLGALDEVRETSPRTGRYDQLGLHLWAGLDDQAHAVARRESLGRLQQAVDERGDAGLAATVGEEAYGSMRRKLDFFAPGEDVQVVSLLTGEDWRSLFGELRYIAGGQDWRLARVMRAATARVNKPGVTYWTETRLRRELTDAHERNALPDLRADRLDGIGRTDLVSAISKHGGHVRWERELGLR